MLIDSKNTLKKTCLPNSHHTNNKTNEQIQMHIIKNNHSTSYNHFCWEDQFSSEFHIKIVRMRVRIKVCVCVCVYVRVCVLSKWTDLILRTRKVHFICYSFRHGDCRNSSRFSDSNHSLFVTRQNFSVINEERAIVKDNLVEMMYVSGEL
jgi:hypothetical protein